MEQIAIAFTGLIAIWLSQHKDLDKQRYACLFGLAGQPFWFYAFYTHAQWGMLVLAVFYTWAWLQGFRNHWLKKG